MWVMGTVVTSHLSLEKKKKKKELKENNSLSMPGAKPVPQLPIPKFLSEMEQATVKDSKTHQLTAEITRW